MRKRGDINQDTPPPTEVGGDARSTKQAAIDQAKAGEERLSALDDDILHQASDRVANRRRSEQR